jgi:hypothetical protein
VLVLLLLSAFKVCAISSGSDLLPRRQNRKIGLSKTAEVLHVQLAIWVVSAGFLLDVLAFSNLERGVLPACPEMLGTQLPDRRAGSLVAIAIAG